MVRISCLCIFVLLLAGCDFNITSPSPPSQTQTTNVSVTPPPTPPTPIPPTTTIPPGNGTPPGGAPLPIPDIAQSIANQYAMTYAGLLAVSCQATYGPQAWQYLDGLVIALRNSDQRWGYVCKYGQCADIAADAIGYLGVGTPVRGAKGMWAVDVIANHCGTPPAAAPAHSWNVLGYDAQGTWTPTRF